MNQPTSSCYRESLAEEMGLCTTDNHTQGLFDRNMFGGEGVDMTMKILTWPSLGVLLPMMKTLKWMSLGVLLPMMTSPILPSIPPTKVNMGSPWALDDLSRHMKGVQKRFLVVKHLLVDSEMTSMRSRDERTFISPGHQSKSGILLRGSYSPVLAWQQSTVYSCLKL